MVAIGAKAAIGPVARSTTKPVCVVGVPAFQVNWGPTPAREVGIEGPPPMLTAIVALVPFAETVWIVMPETGSVKLLPTARNS